MHQVGQRPGNHVICGRELAKHIDIHKHETIQNHKMRLVKVDTSNQLADTWATLALQRGNCELGIYKARVESVVRVWEASGS
jgi:hypothetical protein